MNETYVTIRGRLVADPTSRTTRSGGPMTTFRIASSVRRPVTGQPGVWEDAETSFYDVATYRALATNAGASLRKGQPVTVHGRQRITSWQKQDGTTWYGVEVVADAVGHDLAFGTATFAKVGRAQGTDGNGSGDWGGRGAPDDDAFEPASGFGPPTGGFGSPENDPYVVEHGIGAAGRETDEPEPLPEHPVDSNAGPLVPPEAESAA